MALVKLPLRSDLPSYSFRIDLDGQSYNIGIRYNERMNKWFFSIFDSDNNAIRVGKPIFTGIDVFLGETDPRLPKGPLIPFEETGKLIDAGVDDLGENVNLFYDEVV